MLGAAAKGLAVLTCIDSRIDPLAMLGLRAGDAKIIRNAGARVTGDSLRSLVLAVNLLGVARVCVVQHTDCAMVGSTDDELRARIGAMRGVDAAGWDFLATTDQLEALHNDIKLIESCPLLPPDLQVGGFIFNVRSGELVPRHCPGCNAGQPEARATRCQLGVDSDAQGSSVVTPDSMSITIGRIPCSSRTSIPRPSGVHNQPSLAQS